MISVIIPIYRVEAYIERCVRSLMEQTLDEVEYIFVDDCSPDGSVKVLERVLAEYPQRQGLTHILRHKTNRGLPAARNTGLGAATGDFIFHCDSDDYLESDALQQMYNLVVKTCADIVYTDWYLTFPNKKRQMKEPECSTAADALRMMLHGKMKWNVWNKLVRRSLYTDTGIVFPEGHGMGEDMTMLLLAFHARKLVHLPYPCYYYVRQNEHAFTAECSASSFDDLSFNAQRTIDALQGKVSEEDLACFKLNVKFPFLISNRKKDYERWQKWFPEANEYIHSHQVSKRARFLEFCATHHLYTPLKFHYFLLHSLQK